MSARPQDPRRRFLSKIIVADGHWIWHGSTSPGGAPAYQLGGGRGKPVIHPYRESYRLFRGLSVRGLRRQCEEQLCVKPGHWDRKRKEVAGFVKLYYKAVRPDGTDFHTGSVDYAAHLASGEKLPPIKVPKGTKRKTCSNTVYHASDTPSETLIGGSWPCRLFEVTGKSVASEGHKHGFVTMRVVKEIESWKALGPNGEAVAALIERAKQLTPEEVRRLDATWDDTWIAARDAALALVVRDLITDEQFDLLYGPWAVVGG